MAETYTIQFRRGMYADFDTSKIRPGEPVAILGNDPSVPSGKALYIAFAANDVRRLCSIEDISEMVNAGEFVGPQGPKGEKGDKGDPGEKGADGTVAFESLTPEQKESLRGISIKSASIDTDGNLTITFSDGGSEDVGNIMGPQGIQGSKGDKGVGIKKITDYYALSSSNTDKAFGQVWLTTPPTMTAEKKYLWHWQRTDYTDGSFYSTEKGVIGVYGEQGPKGDKGDVGPKGDNMSDEQAQQIEQNKTDIASLKVETGSLKEDISTKITKFYASSQGKPHLADSDNGKIMDMMLYGKSEQKQYSGKNLFDKSTSKSAWISDDGIYIEKGEIGENTDVVSDYISVKENSTYIASFKTNYAANLIYWCTYNANKEFVSITKIANKITIPTGIRYVRVMISMQQQYCVAVNDELQVELGTEPTTYEPYTGGIPSPNPDYPQEIKSVVNPTVKVRGKNLWDNFKTLSSGNVEQKNGTYIATTSTMQVDITPSSAGVRPLPLKANNTYTFSLKTTVSTSSNRYLCLIYTNGENKNIGFRNNNFIKFVPERDVEKIGFILYGSVAGDKAYDVQLEMGSKATSYEPYHEQTVTLPYTLNAIPVESGGNVTIDGQQYIADYVDVERGKLVRCVYEIEVNGEDKSFVQVGGYCNYSVRNLPNAKEKENEGTYSLSSFFSEPVMFNNEFWVLYVRKQNYAQVLNDSAKNKTGHITYALATPTEIDLTPEEIAAFKALTTYYPTTNISVNSEQLDGYTVFNYPISMANGWNYVKQQLNDNRDYIYDMDLQSAEAYVNSEYAVALTELEV